MKGELWVQKEGIFFKGRSRLPHSHESESVHLKKKEAPVNNRKRTEK
ncbi:hypothetical protein ES703_49400 [subsurface metagenome]